MNRNYSYDPHYAYKPTTVSNLPIEEQLRLKFANRGLGAINPQAVYGQKQVPMQQRPAQRPAQSRPAQQRPSRPGSAQRPAQSRAMTQRSTNPPTRHTPDHTPQRTPLYEARTRRVPLPTAALIALIVCTLTVLSLVMGAAMVSRASEEVSDLQNQAASLANTERELSQALDRKNDLRVIERIAVDELGMIGTDLITKKYISFSGIDVIEAYDDGEGETVGLSTLLAAIGISID